MRGRRLVAPPRPPRRLHFRLQAQLPQAFIRTARRAGPATATSRSAALAETALRPRRRRAGSLGRVRHQGAQRRAPTPTRFTPGSPPPTWRTGRRAWPRDSRRARLRAERLANLLGPLNLFAFALHAVQDCVSDLWRQGRARAGTRRNFFATLRFLTEWFCFRSWTALFETLLRRRPPADPRAAAIAPS